MSQAGWSEDRVTTLKSLWLDGLSASQIAAQLGGVTRNAVIGKIHRLGLSGRVQPSKPARMVHSAKVRVSQCAAGTRATPANRPSPLPSQPDPVLEGPGLASSVTMLGAHVCKWPIGDPKADRFHLLWPARPRPLLPDAQGAGLSFRAGVARGSRSGHSARPGRTGLMRTPPWRGLAAWLLEIDRQVALMRSRRALYERFDATARLLTGERIRACCDGAAMAALEPRLRAARHPGGHALRGLDRVWSRAELGVLVTEAINRGRQLAMGRLRPRAKGPSLDPSRLPDERLDGLIQRHWDLDMVEALRAERPRRERG